MHWTGEHEETSAPKQVAPPSASAVTAAISLLVDPDPRVVALCRRHLLAWGTAALPHLHRASADTNPRMRMRARALARTLEMQQWLQGIHRFARAVHRVSVPSHRDHRVLEIGALLLSSLGRVERLERGAASDTIKQYANELRSAIRMRPRTAASCARALRELLGNRLGYSSAQANRFDVENSLFDVVVESRRGQQLPLTILYLVVARRAGVCATAVEFAGSTFARVHGARSVLLDPARGGKVVTQAECVRDLRARGYTGRPSPRFQELSDRELLQRLLACLRRVYGYREDGEVLRAISSATLQLAEVGA